MPKRRRNQRGVTLLEVLTAVALTFVVLSAAIPNLRRLAAPYALASTARLIAGDCATARLGAIARNQRHRVRIDPSTNVWAIERETAPGIWLPVGETRALPAGAVVSAPTPANPLFDTRGMMPATVVITLGNGTKTRTVTVNVLGQTTIS